MIELAKLERIARRHTLTAEEAQDVVQDVLVAAVAAGRSLEDPGFPAWAAGAMRRQAAFLARSYGRRRRREATASASGPAITPRFPDAFLDMLPDGLRRFARLVNAAKASGAESVVLYIMVRGGAGTYRAVEFAR